MAKFFKYTAVVGLVAGLLAGAALVPMQAWAEIKTLTFNFNVTGVDGAPTVAIASFTDSLDNLNEVGTAGNGLAATVEGRDGNFIIFAEDASVGELSEINRNRTSVTCTSSQSCSVSISGVDTSDPAYKVHFATGGDTPLEILYLDGLNNYNEFLDHNENFVVRFHEEHHTEFDGNAYVIWACGEGDDEVCLHLIEGIDNTDGQTAYYSASDITDITDPTRVFDKFGKYDDEDYVRGMALPEDLANWVKEYAEDEEATIADVDWSKVDIYKLFRGDEEIGGVKVMPVGEPQGASSYTSYGDRAFRLTIYGEGYKSIDLGDLSDLYYIPYTMQDDIYIDAIDISRTTKDAPARMDALLLERTVSIKANAQSGLDIAKIEPLDVPAGAVEVSKDGDSYKLKFNSNFYDEVVFKITDASGKEYYLCVARSILKPHFERNRVHVDFYFDNTTSYTDYEIIATYAYKDGTSEIKVMENAGEVPNGLGDVTPGYEINGGQNLKLASYKVEEEDGFLDNLEGVYFNVRKAGTSAQSYAGTLAGSGIGSYLEVPTFR